MKKIAVVLNMLAPYWYESFNYLANQGLDIKIFISVINEPNRKYEYDFSIMCFKIKKIKSFMIDFSKLKFPTQYFHFEYGLFWDLFKYKPDIIISNQLGFRTLITYIYSKLFSIPIITWICVSPHTERHNSYLREKFRHWLIPKSKYIWTNLTEANEYLINKQFIAKEKIINTPYSVNSAKYANLVSIEKKKSNYYKENFKLKGLVFLYVGQIIQRKGINELIEAFTSLNIKKLPAFSILFVGGKLNQKQTNKLLSNCIIFTNIDFVQPEDLYKFYALSDVFVFPTLEDEWGIVLNEAISSGLPVLSSIYAASTIDLVKNGYNGFSFDPLNKLDFINKIKMILNLHNNDLLQLSQNSLEEAKLHDILLTNLQMHESIRLILK